MTKIQAIKAKLHEMILADQFPGGKLPGERELSIRLGAGRNTIRAALQELCEKGLIERHRKIGTLIRNSPAAPDKKLAGLIVRTEGSLCESYYHHILTEFIAAGYSVQSISTSPISGQIWKPNKMVEIAVRKLLKSDPEILVVDGYVNGRIPLINEIRSRHPIMLDFYDSPRKRDFTGVWFDYRKAGYLIGKHLIERGCRRPVLFSMFVPPCVRFNPDTYVHHRDKLIIEGFRQAMAEGGIDPEYTVISCSAATARDHYSIFNSLIDGTRCMPDGFCGADDTLTVKFMRALLEEHCRIPENIVFAGIGNSQWSGESALYPFSTVDLHPELLARTIVRQAELKPEARQDVFIEPTLVERHEKQLKQKHV